MVNSANLKFFFINHLSIVVNLLRGLVFVGSLYMWFHWTVITLVFDDTGTLSYLDFIFGFIFNIGLFIALFPIQKIFLIIPTVLILFTSYLYVNTLLFGKNWQDSGIGLVINILATLLIIALQKLKRTQQPANIT